MREKERETVAEEVVAGLIYLLCVGLSLFSYFPFAGVSFVFLR